MNDKRFWGSVFMVWAIIWLTDWFFHGVWMASWYQQTAELWRPMEEMHRTMWAMWVGNFVFAWAYVWIFTKGIDKKNPWHQAFRYSLAIFLIASVPKNLATWAISPYPTDLIFRWIFIEAVQVFLCGFCLTWAYKAKINWSHA